MLNYLLHFCLFFSENYSHEDVYLIAKNNLKVVKTLEKFFNIEIIFRLLR